ncbi:hypothetical protein NDU88_007036 [Pleurodeles waltl]|uniref:Uncharacterized protein n=1 Tax=Pleurodeles waltl TaxID=8319 RepID=A0AAV7NW81_PLEWA|nr:hypothetical protein NDU88_007036 [Pleurodeles waltl]
MVQNELAELKRQINAVAGLGISGAAGVGNKDISQSFTPPLGPKSPAASESTTGHHKGSAWDFDCSRVTPRPCGRLGIEGGALCSSRAVFREPGDAIAIL